VLSFFGCNSPNNTSSSDFLLSDVVKLDVTSQDMFYTDVKVGVPGTWISIKAGTFFMGSPKTEKCRSSDEAQHKVILTHNFEIQSTEVTAEQFYSIMGYKPSSSPLCISKCPVNNISWHMALSYCNALSSKMGIKACYVCDGTGTNVECKETVATKGKGIYSCLGYRLLTEAEWEYTYRAGTISAFYSGPISVCSGPDANADRIGWYKANSNSKSHMVTLKKPNAWGLYDMAGNLWEWCHDLYQKDLGLLEQTDPVGVGSLFRVLHGGSWFYNTHTLRGAHRNKHDPIVRILDVGFRCARTMNSNSF